MNPNNASSFYDTSLFATITGAIIGFIGSILSVIIGCIINSKIQKKNDIKNLLIMITQSNHRLFSLIILGSENKVNIDYIALRSELQSCSIVYLLPKSLKEEFIKLYKIFFTNPNYYDEHENEIYLCLKEITEIMNGYGVYFFDK